jgi:hypothetical protein
METVLDIADLPGIVKFMRLLIPLADELPVFFRVRPEGNDGFRRLAARPFEGFRGL